MQVVELIKDIENICFSYLEEREQIYYKKEWNKLDKSEACNLAACKGWLDLLIWAIKTENGYDFIGRPICIYAAMNGHLHILKWFTENGGNLDGHICSIAAQYGNIEILIWARDNGCDWRVNKIFSEFICPSAANSGHLHILKWLKENDCPCGGDIRYHKD